MPDVVWWWLIPGSEMRNWWTVRTKTATRNRHIRAAYREHKRHISMPGHRCPGGNMMTSLFLVWTHTAQHNTGEAVSESLGPSPCNNQPHFHPSALLIIKLLKHTKHCSMLHSYYQRNALFLLAVKDFIISVVLGNRLTLILTCFFNQLPKETSSLLQALARQHWETYAKFIFSK